MATTNINFKVADCTILNVEVQPAIVFTVDAPQEIVFELNSSGPAGPQGPAGTANADTVAYNNTTSGLTATNVQDAIDEIVDDYVTKTMLNTTGGVTVNGGNW